jgi:ribose/xylose/arabinose/galactoside ABC-type transport system permease subunit
MTAAGPASKTVYGRSDRRSSTLLWPVLALALLLAFNLLRFETGGGVHASIDFFRLQLRDGHLYGSLIDILNRAAPILLTGLGMTVVIATGGVDLSVGAIVAIAGSVAAMLLTSGSSVTLAVAAALAVSLVAGLWNGLLVAGGVQPIVATLVLMVAGRGIAQLLTGGQIPTLESVAPDFGYIGGGWLCGLPFSLTLVAIVAAGLAVLTRGTALGLFIETVGANESASRYAGVSARRIKLFVYAVSGLCAGVAGLIVASNIQAADANNAGMYLELDAILAAVIGGTSLAGGRFSLPGAIVGALVIQTLNVTILRLPIAVDYNLVIKAAVVIAVCLLQSERARGMLWRRRVAA